MTLEEKLKNPACSNWISINDKMPNRFQYVLVNTQYCKYPAQTALWNGFEFKSTDKATFLNITHWAEINDLGRGLKQNQSFETLTDSEYLEHSIRCIDEAFSTIWMSKTKNENISMMFECIGRDVSSLRNELEKLWDNESTVG